jgi:hypothetical protein
VKYYGWNSSTAGGGDDFVVLGVANVFFAAGANFLYNDAMSNSPSESDESEDVDMLEMSTCWEGVDMLVESKVFSLCGY